MQSQIAGGELIGQVASIRAAFGKIAVGTRRERRGFAREMPAGLCKAALGLAVAILVDVNAVGSGWNAVQIELDQDAANGLGKASKSFRPAIETDHVGHGTGPLRSLCGIPKQWKR